MESVRAAPGGVGMGRTGHRCLLGQEAEVREGVIVAFAHVAAGDYHGVLGDGEAPEFAKVRRRNACEGELTRVPCGSGLRGVHVYRGHRLDPAVSHVGGQKVAAPGCPEAAASHVDHLECHVRMSPGSLVVAPSCGRRLLVGSGRAHCTGIPIHRLSQHRDHWREERASCASTRSAPRDLDSLTASRMSCVVAFVLMPGTSRGDLGVVLYVTANISPPPDRVDSEAPRCELHGGAGG